MKLSTLFGIATLTLASAAFAHDLTYTGPIKSKETKTVKIELPSGKMTIEVFSSYDTKFNCQFAQSYGGLVFEQNDTNRCVANVNVTTSEATMSVSVTNLGKDSDYRIWVHDARQ